MSKKVLNVEQMAKVLDVKPITVYKHLEKGKYPSYCLIQHTAKIKTRTLFDWEMVKKMYDIDDDYLYRKTRIRFKK